MGAWGIGTLDNDAALDAMITFEKNADLTGATLRILNSTYPQEQLLGAAIVDASLNGADEEILGDGFYGYEDFFKGLTKTPQEGLRGHALRALAQVKEDLETWDEDCRAARKALYEKLEERLTA